LDFARFLEAFKVSFSEEVEPFRLGQGEHAREVIGELLSDFDVFIEAIFLNRTKEIGYSKKIQEL
jgi:hypothetical protein